MGQAEIIQYLKQNPHQWFTAKDIADVTRVSPTTVIGTLKRMRKVNDIQYKTLTGIARNGLNKYHTLVYKYNNNQPQET